MTPDDIVRVAIDLHRRAGAACLAAEPHAGRFMEWPCQDHLNEARRQLAIPARHVSAPATAPSIGVPPCADGGALGAAGVSLAPTPHQAGQRAGGSTSVEPNRPGVETRPAERATAFAREQDTE